MSTGTKKLVEAILKGRTKDISTEFQREIAERVTIKLNDLREEVQKEMFNENVDKVYSKVDTKNAQDNSNDYRRLANREQIMEAIVETMEEAGIELSEDCYSKIDTKNAQDNSNDYKKLSSREQIMEEIVETIAELAHIDGIELDEEMLSELSKKTLSNYVRAANSDSGKHKEMSSRYDHAAKELSKAADHTYTQGHTTKDHEGMIKRGGETRSAIYRTVADLRDQGNKHDTKHVKRTIGVRKALNRLAKEEFDMDLSEEQLDELSRKTLASYVQKAATDMAQSTARAQQSSNDINATGSYKKKVLHLRDKDAADQRAGKRLGGIARATKKLAKD